MDGLMSAIICGCFVSCRWFAQSQSGRLEQKLKAQFSLLIFMPSRMQNTLSISRFVYLILYSARDLKCDILMTCTIKSELILIYVSVEPVLHLFPAGE